MSDLNLIQHVINDDQKALRALFDKYYADLVRYAIKITGLESSSEEIVQDIFIKLWEKRKQLKIEQNVAGYLIRAVKNQCLNLVSSRYHKTIHEDVTSAAHLHVSTDSAEQAIVEIELAEAIARACEALSDQTALVFSLSRHGEMTYPQIAEELDISVKTVEYHISKAIKSIRADLLSQGFQVTVLTMLAKTF